MSNNWKSDLVGTKKTEFSINKAKLESSGLSANRVHSLPDKNGTLAMLSDLHKSVTFGIRGATLGDRADTAIPLPFGGTIRSWKLFSPATASAVLTLKKNGSNISASAKPSLASANLASSSTLTGWTVAVAENDILMVSVDSTSGANLILQIIIEV